MVKRLYAEARPCVQCGLEFRPLVHNVARGWGRYCSKRCGAVANGAKKFIGRQTEIRRLAPGEPLPTGRPSRYRTDAGYINLRWKTGTRQYVETTEHRAVTGNVLGHVHHINGVRDDNRLENLQVVSPREHQELHRTLNVPEACRLYLEGMNLPELSDVLGMDASYLSRALRAAGVVMRTPGVSRSFPVPMAEVHRMHSAGYRVPAIAKAVGLTTHIVRRAMKNAGIQAHRSGRPRESAA